MKKAYKLLSIFLCCLLVFCMVPMTVFAAEMVPDYLNAKITGDTLSWDLKSGADQYGIWMKNVDTGDQYSKIISSDTTTADLKEILDSSGAPSATYKVRLGIGLPHIFMNEDGEKYFEGTYTYTSNGKLDTPTGLTIDKNKCSWDTVEKASKYVVKFYEVGSSYSKDARTTETTYEFPYNLIKAGKEYYFTVQAFSTIGYEPSEIATSEKYKCEGFTLTFDGNGGTGSMDPVYPVSNGYVVPECGFTPPEGKIFSHWKIEYLNYTVGKTVNIEKDTTAVAQWQDIPDEGIAEAKAYVDVPKAGVPLDTTIEIPAGANYTVEFYKWRRNYTDVTDLTAPCLAGDYELYVYFKPNSGYQFTSETKFTINDGNFKGSFGNTGTYGKMAEFKVVNEHLITEAKAIVDLPAYGQNPDMTIEVPADAHYSVEFVSWYYMDGSAVHLTATDTFDAGDYHLRVVFTPDPNYYFNSTTTFDVGGVTDSDMYGGYGSRDAVFTVEAPSHVHSYPETEYNGKDGEHHWFECKDESCPDKAGSVMGRDPHEFVDGVCVCGYEQENTDTNGGNNNEHEHDFDLDHNDKYHWDECDCGEIEDKEKHAFGKWVVVKKPTATKDGVKMKECKICGYSEKAYISATGSTASSDQEETNPNTGAI